MMRRVTIMLMAAVVLSALLTDCGQSKKVGIGETVFKEATTFIDLQWRMEKKVDVSDYDHANLFLDDGSINTYGYSLRHNNQIIVKAYDRDLNLISEKRFNIGHGPGDIGPGGHIFPIGEHIYIPDNTQRKISIFDKEMNFKKFVTIPFAFYNMRFTRDGKTIVSTQFMFDKAKKVVNHIEITSFPELKKKQIFTLGPCLMMDEKRVLLRGECPEFYYFLKNENIYLINMKTYQIIMFDLSGKMLKRVRVQVEKIPVPPEMKKVWIKDQTPPQLLNRSKFVDTVQPASWMIPLGKGFVVIRRYGYDTSCEGLVEGDYFNYDLQLLGKVKFPCFYLIYKLFNGYFHRVFEYDSGYVYLLTQDLQETDEDINLEKWKVVE